MVRFQAAYKAHLLKQQEKVNLELRELVSGFVNTKTLEVDVVVILNDQSAIYQQWDLYQT